MKKSISILLTLIVSSIQADNNILNESLKDIMNMQSEATAEIGSRSGSKSAINSKVPVDVITHKQIARSGLSSLTEVLRYFIPTFNAPQASLNDGSDHIRLFTLRGMSPDQVLVLVNGKRVHTSALLNVNATIGRGSSSVDLDTITISAIEKIEILRDGAAAQYGSDAIAGVINIILKGITDHSSISVQGGKYTKGDGEQLYANSFINTPLKYDGFVNLSISAVDQKQTNRAGADRRVDPAKVYTHIGIPQSQNYNAVLNIELPQENNINIYAVGLFNYRDSQASAFYRTPDENNPIYPEGYLPLINAKIFDYSFIGGIKGEIDYFKWDLSNTFGYNEINYYLSNSMNKSIGVNSPTSFYNGTLSFLQNTTNLDISKKISKLSLAAGLEYRHENYQIKKGDTQSYILGELHESAGSQGFAGYSLENETDDTRKSYALYLDTTYDFTEDFSLEGAARYEDYSDFGETTNFKLALSYRIVPELLLRTSASSGFRAPSLSQSSYSQTSSFYSDDNTNDSVSMGLYKTDHEASRIFGASELKPELSKHFSIGSVYELGNISFMLDYFYVEVDDKILLSDMQKATTQAQIDVLNKYDIAQLSFFTNAVNTQTQGIDLKLDYLFNFENSSKLDIGVWYNYSVSKVVAFNSPIITRENLYRTIDQIENGQPKSNLKILSNYQWNKFNSTLNVSRYGHYQQVSNDTAHSFSPQWVADLELSYKATKSILYTVGGHNIFDTTPDKWDMSGIGYGYDGIVPYSLYAPAGISGAFYYVRASIEF